VVELRDKITNEIGAAVEFGGGNDVEVIEALIAMGYSAQEARSAIKDSGKVGSVNERVSAALKSLS
jgi:Holliday junction resolvasome RuvABC DNA-binding subunit